MKDKLYSKPLVKISPFAFDKRVARVFGDMIGRSVPGYSDIIRMSGILAAGHVKPRTRVYDLGCSLGAASQAVFDSVPLPFDLVAVDSSSAMIDRARTLLKPHSKANLKLECARIQEMKIRSASFVMLNFVLQFIPKSERLPLLKKICSGMLRGGALMISEKIDFKDPAEREKQRALHEEFKRAQGYSKLEISQKRTALEKVLIPETFEVHRLRLKKAGFRHVYVWFRCFNFISMLAVK